MIMDIEVIKPGTVTPKVNDHERLAKHSNKVVL